jgi:hypothetical protein
MEIRQVMMQRQWMSGQICPFVIYGDGNEESFKLIQFYIMFCRLQLTR